MMGKALKKKHSKKRLSPTSQLDLFSDAEYSKGRHKFLDEDIQSSDDELEGEQRLRSEENKEAEIEETPAEKRKRLADEFLNNFKAKERKLKEEEEDELDFSESRFEKEWERDSLILKQLQQQQLEESGRVRRAIASRVQRTDGAFQFVVKHRKAVTAVAVSEDDSRGFSASKDGSIVHWDVDSGKVEKYSWPSEQVLKSHGVKDPQTTNAAKKNSTKHSKTVLALAVSSDDRYLATGGQDRHVHLWDVRTRQHVHAFPGHMGPVSCLTFRQGTSELFSGSFDGLVKIWHADERAHIQTLSGHGKDNEVLAIDCLRKERTLTVGRDRSMRWFKVLEGSGIKYFAPEPSSFESCCFINDDELLSGFSDGSIAIWKVKRPKPFHIVKNAHVSLSEEGGDKYSSSTALSWINSVAVCRGSDLAASGAGNGSVRLWATEGSECSSKRIRPLLELPLVGFVNSLAFAKSGRFLVAGVGQEPRLGRWGRVSEAENGVAVHALEQSS